VRSLRRERTNMNLIIACCEPLIPFWRLTSQFYSAVIRQEISYFQVELNIAVFHYEINIQIIDQI
jgi:hypothetical protein